ncbi:DEAD/DEAH box helicase family protein (plasmid) [Haladaptatus sp. SPP-AMP-3]|uniref:restriction endonuclease n=1 Tax=Haladaptatus sp. SPP-AMP-3 TaxID=3121295 RepID=UPI003C2C0DE9
MEFDFDPNLDHQTTAVQSIVDLFDGHPDTHREVPFGHGENLAISNHLHYNDDEVLDHLTTVQERNGIEASVSLRPDDALREFSVEMETGTGKTYVYLRTIHELFQQYGWKKFIILVPSIAIREGVLKSIEQTAKHFDKLYGNPPFNHCEYDSSSLGDVIRFGTSNQIEVMVMTLQSINRGEDNIMFQHQDALSGDRPVDRISSAQPVVIMDEPQNMESENSRDAIKQLNPLFTLRYSATHRTVQNLIYRLTPVDAHDLGLVKQIEVLSVTAEEDFNKTYIKVLEVDTDSQGPKARLELHKNLSSGTKKGKKTVRTGDNLYRASKNVSSYRDLVVEFIDVRDGVVEFSNGVTLSTGEQTDDDIEVIQHRQIRETVREHFEKARRFHDQGIKVLSLFFIDQVANFRGKSGEESGHLWKAFCEVFNDLKHEDKFEDLFGDLSPEEASGAYFAKTRQGKIKTQAWSIRNDVESYELIMRDKEQLLSFDEPTQFIFSHSALQEGWDNPNVFQICTLNNTVSQTKKRQELGRGVRLPVRQDGTRLDEGDDRNTLTVIANESYAEYAAALQEEYEDEGYSGNLGEKTRERRQRKTVKPKQEVIDHSEAFANLWKLIAPQTRYRTQIDTDALIETAADRLDNITVNASRMRLDMAELALTDEYEVESRVQKSGIEEFDRTIEVPDVIGDLAEATNLTRETIACILLEADCFESLSDNPHDFVAEAKQLINAVKSNHVVDSLQYERTDEQYAIEILTEIQTYADDTVSVENGVYDEIIFDSLGEKQFAKRIDTDESVVMFMKLPPKYTIPTPYGDYNPDWGIVHQRTDWDGDSADATTLYLIRETKFDISNEDLRPAERIKIKCARKHFDAIEVDFTDIYNEKETLDQQRIEDLLAIAE